MKNIRINLLYFIAFLGIGAGLQAAQISLDIAYQNAQNRVNGLSIQLDSIKHSIMDEINNDLIAVASSDDNLMINEQSANNIIDNILQQHGFAANNAGKTATLKATPTKAGKTPMSPQKQAMYTAMKNAARSFSRPQTPTASSSTAAPATPRQPEPLTPRTKPETSSNQVVPCDTSGQHLPENQDPNNQTQPTTTPEPSTSTQTTTSGSNPGSFEDQLAQALALSKQGDRANFDAYMNREGTIALPQELQNKNIIHLISASQNGAQCGAYAACNLLAIQELEKQNKEISRQNVQNLCQQYIAQWMNRLDENKTVNPHVTAENAEVRDLLVIGEQMGLENMHFLRYNNGRIESAGQLNTDFDVEEMFRDIKLLDTSETVRFIFNTGGHYVAASVKKVNGIVTIAYLNSTNVPLENDTRACAFVNYLYNNTR